MRSLLLCSDQIHFFGTKNYIVFRHSQQTGISGTWFRESMHDEKLRLPTFFQQVFSSCPTISSPWTRVSMKIQHNTSIKCVVFFRCFLCKWFVISLPEPRRSSCLPFLQCSVSLTICSSSFLFSHLPHLSKWVGVIYK